MYSVALCEDEKVFSEQLEKACCDIFNKLDIEHCVTVFDSGAELLRTFVQKSRHYDLYLLDIIMDKPNGMELAYKIRETDEDAAIIFITSSRDYALQGYDVKALHYLIKPVDTSILEKLIQTDYSRRFQKKYIILETSTEKYRVAMEDIISLETTGRKVAVMLIDRTIYWPGKVAKLLEMLADKRFVRCHQAFAVNVCNIRELTKQSAIAVNGKEIPVSRSYSKKVQAAFVRQIRSV